VFAREEGAGWSWSSGEAFGRAKEELAFRFRNMEEAGDEKAERKEDAGERGWEEDDSATEEAWEWARVERERESTSEGRVLPDEFAGRPEVEDSMVLPGAGEEMFVWEGDDCREGEELTLEREGYRSVR
jgi:hypothetical protein